MNRSVSQYPPDIIRLPFRYATALLQEAIRGSLPKGPYVVSTQQEEGSLRITVSHEYLGWICTLSIEELLADQSRRVITFPSQVVLTEGDAAMTDPLGGGYTVVIDEQAKRRLRDKQAQRRQVCDAFLDRMQGRWDALLAMSHQGSTQAARLKKSGGRPRNPDNDWASEQIHRYHRPPREVRAEWDRRNEADGRFLADPDRQFRAILSPSQKRTRRKPD